MLLKNTSYKSKFFVLLACCLILIIISYHLAIYATIKLKRNLDTFNVKIDQISTAPQQINNYEKKLDLLNNMIGDSLIDIPEFQQRILISISNYCVKNSLILKDFPQVHIYLNKDFQYVTSYATIQGSFLPLLTLLHLLENSSISGRPVSVEFSTIEDRETKARSVTMKLYIQTIKKKG